MQLFAEKKRIVFYTIGIFLFALAGVFQALDSHLIEFWHAFFSLSAHTIFLILSIAWGITLIHRVVRKDLKIYLVAIAVLIVFFLVTRMIKYGLTKSTDTLNRYMWYSYYVPQCLIPTLILLSSLSLESENNKPLRKNWLLLFVPALILIILIYTNDIHEWVFQFSLSKNNFSYKHQVVFYIVLSWEIIVTLIGLVVMICKCKVSACKKKMWIPITTFILCVALSTICFLLNTSAFKIPELLCLTCIALIESSINIGLIPSNDNYENYFHNSKYSAFITDEQFNLIYNVNSTVPLDKEVLKKASIKPIMLNKYMRLIAKKIHGGYVYRIEDLTIINKTNETLKETNEQILEENYLIEAENKIKEEKTQIEEQTRLFAKIEECTRLELDQLTNYLSDLKEGNNKINFVAMMRFLSVIMVYIKRRSNLELISEKNRTVDVNELSLAIKESLDYLSLMNIDYHYECRISGKINGKKACLLYEFFESCIASYNNRLNAVIVHLYRHEQRIILLIESDDDNINFIQALENLKNKFPQHKDDIEVKKDDAIYYSLSLEDGDNV